MLSNMELLEQVITVAQISRSFNLSISLERPARRDDAASYNYNCFMWAFGLMDRPWLSSLVSGTDDIFPRSDFVNHLVHHYLLEITRQEMKAGDIAIYFNAEQAVHAGTWDGDLLISKWGIYSHLWRHGVCELPIEYGEEIRFYRRLPDNTIREAFERWQRHLPSRIAFKHPLPAPAVSCNGKPRVYGNWMSR